MAEYSTKSDAEAAVDRANLARRTERAQTTTGFVGGALALGALGPQGRKMIPETIMGIDSDFVVGGALLFYGRRGSTKRHAQARGASYAALAGGLRDLGASLATRF